MATRPTGAARAATATVLAAALAVTPSQGAAHAHHHDHLDPARLERGADPRVAYLVHNTIRDGERQVRATKAHHLGLWETDRGYVVLDRLRRSGRLRLTFLRRTGRKDHLVHGAYLSAPAVSLNGRRIAWSKQRLYRPATVTVMNPHTGRVVAQRHFDMATVIAVTGRRVLMVRRPDGGRARTVWWDYRADSVQRLSGRVARDADLRNNRVVLRERGTGRCGWVAKLTRPRHTLWRTCRVVPVDWAPNGDHALATDLYFDHAGTDRWITQDGRTGARAGRVDGRLGWTAVWETNRRFLALAQGDDGAASVVRCTVGGSCERASRLWHRTVNPDAYYVGPPVVLAER